MICATMLSADVRATGTGLPPAVAQWKVTGLNAGFAMSKSAPDMSGHIPGGAVTNGARRRDLKGHPGWDDFTDYPNSVRAEPGVHPLVYGHWAPTVIDVATGDAKENSKRISPSAIAAEVGVMQVQTDLIKLGWGPVDNRQHDLGTDLLVHVRDDRGFDRALLIGAQVKAGDSYFGSPAKVPQVGWWYAEDDVDHFDLWSNHALPHLLILHDIRNAVSYWVRVTPDRVTSTGTGAKILVPAANRLERDQLPALLDELSRPIGGESINFEAVAPGDRLRHALLAPFDLSNRTSPAATPLEYIASVMVDPKWRVSADWQPPKRRTWLVSFAEAVAAWRSTGDAGGLSACATSASHLRDKCAATMLYASCLRAAERHSEVRSLLDNLITGDRLTPVDHAWCLLQRARASIELGEPERARTDAADALRSLTVLKDNDHVGKTLVRIAARTLYALSEANVEAQTFGPAVHDPIARWRDSKVSAALERASAEAFESLKTAKSQRFVNVDIIEESLNSAAINADLCGDHAEWCRIEGLAAQLQLQRRSDSEPAITDALGRLRRAGSAKAIAIIASHLFHYGPVRPLASAVNSIDPRHIGVTTTRSSLELVRVAGAHYLDQRLQRELALTVLQSLSSVRPRRRAARLLREHVFAGDQLAALASLISFSTDADVHESTALLVANRLKSEHSIDRHRLDSVASQLELGRTTPATYQVLIETCLANGGEISSTVLGMAAAKGDTSVIAVLQERARSGDLAAVDALFEAPERVGLDDSGQRALLRTLERRIRATIKQAEGGSWSFGGDDYARAYCIANIRFAGARPWTPVLDLLRHPLVNPTDKVGSLRILGEFAPDLPPRLRSRLRRLEIPASSTFATAFEVPAAGAIDALRLAVGPTRNGVAIGLRMCFGDEVARTDLARCLGQGLLTELRPLLAPLLRDPSRQVVNASAFALGRLAAQAPEPFLDSLLRFTTTHPGSDVPTATIIGVHRTGIKVASADRRLMLQQLEHHPSGFVRHELDRARSRGLI